MDHNKIIATLNDLIELNHDSIAGFETAVEAVDSEVYRRMFRDYVERHHQFVRELTELVVQHGGDPEAGPTATGALRNAWLGLRTAVSDSDQAIMAICDESEEAALAAYRQAMGSLELSSEETRNVVRRQMSGLRIMHQKVHELSAVLTA